METLGVLKDLDVEKFVNVSLSTALQLAELAVSAGKPLDGRTFYEGISARVQAELEIPYKVFNQIHHPIHWVLFCRDTGKEGYQSPLNFKQGCSCNDTGFYVECTRVIEEKDLPSLVEGALKYAPYLRSRFDDAMRAASCASPAA